MTYELDLTAAVDAAARQACIEGAARQAPEGHQQAAREGAAHAWDTGVVPAIVKHELRELVTPLVHAASHPLGSQAWSWGVRDGERNVSLGTIAPNPYRDSPEVQDPTPPRVGLDMAGADGTLSWDERRDPIRWHIPGTWFDTVGNQWRYIDGDWRVRVAPGGTWVIASALGYGNDGYFPMHRVEQ